MNLKEMPKESRPREKLLLQGASSLSDAEVLAIVLQKGTKGENVVDMSQRILATYSSTHLSKISLKDLQKIKGIGPAKAAQIFALFEFAKRHSPSSKKNLPLRSAKDVFSYSSRLLSGSDREVFLALHLDTKNRVIKEEVVSVGTLNASLIHPREVFKSAVRESANALIFVHNHPSGDPTPSPEDHQVTKQLKEVGELLDIEVLDHVIVGSDSYYSFREDSK